MPTSALTDQFRQDYARLTKQQQDLFKLACRHFVEDLKAGSSFRRGLRVKGIRGLGKGGRRIFELTWDGDGRATFEYGAEIKPGEAHVVWRRIGSHEIFGDP